jgi:Cu+-exporting ATPase
MSTHVSDHHHHSHTHSDGTDCDCDPIQAGATATDPVCGMEVEIGDSALRATHEGKTYYFCSPSCGERFVANPSIYLRSISIQRIRK